jgi:hypothetical protein
MRAERFDWRGVAEIASRRVTNTKAGSQAGLFLCPQNIFLPREGFDVSFTHVHVTAFVSLEA